MREYESIWEQNGTLRISLKGGWACEIGSKILLSRAFLRWAQKARTYGQIEMLSL